VLQIDVFAYNITTAYFEDPEQFNPDRWLKGPLALQLDRTASSQPYDQSGAY
jgi:cytochrome P450